MFLFRVRFLVDDQPDSRIPALHHCVQVFFVEIDESSGAMRSNFSDPQNRTSSLLVLGLEDGRLVNCNGLRAHTFVTLTGGRNLPKVFSESLLTASKAAKHLGVSEFTLRDAVRDDFPNVNYGQFG